MKGLLIAGNGGHGRVVLDCALCTCQYQKIAFLTNYDAEPVRGYICYNEETVDMEGLKEEYTDIIVALGNNEIRLSKSLHYREIGFHLATLIHPAACISPLATVGEGTVVLANAVVNACASVGKACIINTSAIVEHDCVLGDGVHLSPKAALGGGTTVGEKTWMCIGASASDHIKIGANCIVAAGAAVISDISNGTMNAGVPAVQKK